MHVNNASSYFVHLETNSKTRESETNSEEKENRIGFLRRKMIAIFIGSTMPYEIYSNISKEIKGKMEGNLGCKEGNCSKSKTKMGNFTLLNIMESLYSSVVP